MSTMSPAQIGAYAAGAGFAGDDLKTAVAVALAESSGDPRAHNTNAATGDNSYGLWQINMIGALGPDRRKALKIGSNDALFDPTVNARAAMLVYKQQGWNGWTTYKRGLHKKYLDSAATVPTTTTPVVAEDGGLLDSVKDKLDMGIPEAIQGVGKNLFKAFANFQAVGLGVGLIGVGLIIVLREPIAKGAALVKKVK